MKIQEVNGIRELISKDYQLMYYHRQLVVSKRIFQKWLFIKNNEIKPKKIWLKIVWRWVRVLVLEILKMIVIALDSKVEELLEVKK